MVQYFCSDLSSINVLSASLTLLMVMVIESGLYWSSLPLLTMYRILISSKGGSSMQKATYSGTLSVLCKQFVFQFFSDAFMFCPRFGLTGDEVRPENAVQVLAECGFTVDLDQANLACGNVKTEHLNRARGRRLERRR